MVGDVAGGPGWVIRAADLRPAITDPEAFRDGLRDDPLREAIELLWNGDPDGALLLLRPLGRSQRVRALTADCRRDLGDVAAAVREYDRLVAECAGTAREAVMRQHRGKALLAAGEADRAVEDFAAVVDLRRASDPLLLASAEQALAVATALSRRSGTGPGRPDAAAQPGRRTSA